MLNKRKLKYRNSRLLNSTPGFGDQYHKSRKYLILFSGILFGLTFAGFRIGKTSPSSLDKSFPNTDIQITFENPEVIQYILIILIVYFWYRLIIEWTLTEEDTRNNLSAKIDYYISQFIGILSLSSFYLQKLLNYKLVDIIDRDFVISLVLATYVGEISGLIYQQIRKVGFHQYISRRRFPLTLIITILLIVSMIYFVFTSKYPVITGVLGAIVTLGSFWIFYKTRISKLFEFRLFSKKSKEPA